MLRWCTPRDSRAKWRAQKDGYRVIFPFPPLFSFFFFSQTYNNYLQSVCSLPISVEILNYNVSMTNKLGIIDNVEIVTYNLY